MGHVASNPSASPWRHKRLPLSHWRTEVFVLRIVTWKFNLKKNFFNFLFKNIIRSIKILWKAESEQVAVLRHSVIHTLIACPRKVFLMQTADGKAGEGWSSPKEGNISYVPARKEQTASWKGDLWNVHNILQILKHLRQLRDSSRFRNTFINRFIQEKAGEVHLKIGTS